MRDRAPLERRRRNRAPWGRTRRKKASRGRRRKRAPRRRISRASAPTATISVILFTSSAIIVVVWVMTHIGRPSPQVCRRRRFVFLVTSPVPWPSTSSIIFSIIMARLITAFSSPIGTTGSFSVAAAAAASSPGIVHSRDSTRQRLS